MTDKTKELLAVLDLPEEEQDKWFFIHGIFHHHPTDEFRIESLADLAFRLRDEFPSIWGHHLLEMGRRDVFEHRNHKTREWTEEHCDLIDSWFVEWGKPIDLIIAALIAKAGE